MGLGLKADLQREPIASHHASRRMQHHGMTGSGFGIKGTLYFQRSLDKDAIENGFIVSLGIVEFEVSVPGGRQSWGG